jgi:type I restriction enzyme R subunit
MRHLLNTYVQAEPASALGNIDDYTLIELIVETGIHDAIVKKLNAKGRLTKNSIAESIINNIRKTIIRDQLTDPRFYAEMSKLLDDLITLKIAATGEYEKFLKRAEDIVKRMASKSGEHPYPSMLNGFVEAIVLYNNLPTIPADTFVCPADENARAHLALEIDKTMLEHAPAGWKGDETREKQVLNALFPLLNRDRKATSALFEIIKNQPGY